MPSTNARAVFSEDIPGSSLKGRNPASFKVELRFWLKCHGAKNFSALENKKSLVQMVNTYIANGWDDESFLTDPSPEKVYTKQMKARIAALKEEKENVAPSKMSTHEESDLFASVLPSYLQISLHSWRLPLLCIVSALFLDK